jgi:hypothetical protein
MQATVRRQAHITEHLPGNIGQALNAHPRQAARGMYFNDVEQLHGNANADSFLHLCQSADSGGYAPAYPDVTRAFPVTTIYAGHLETTWQALARSPGG